MLKMQNLVKSMPLKLFIHKNAFTTTFDQFNSFLQK